MAFIITTQDGNVVSSVGLAEATEANIDNAFNDLLADTDLNRDNFLVFEVTQDQLNKGIRKVILDDAKNILEIEYFPEKSTENIIYDIIDQEKLAMAEAIVMHEMEIQQLKAELAALKKGEE